MLLTLLTLFIGTPSQAAFHPGEYALYAVDMDHRQYDLRNQVISVDEDQNTLRIRQLIYEKNGALISESIVDELLSDHQNNEEIFFGCLRLPHEYNAQFETIQVEAGTFNTCHIRVMSNGGWFDGWYGDVVYGVIKATRTHTVDFSDFSFELKNHFSI